MTLRQKIRLIIGITLISVIGLVYSTSSAFLLHNFSELEQQDTREQVKRVEQALSDELVQLNVTTRDWAEWDETYAFVEQPNKAYMKNYLNNLSISIININLILYIQPIKGIVFDKNFDLDRQKSIPISPQVEQYFTAKSFSRRINQNNSIKGIIILPNSPVLITSRPILKNDGSGPARGTLIMGRYLNAAAIARLAERTHLSIAMYAVNDAKMPADFQAARSSLLQQQSILVQPLNKNTVAGYTIIKDIYGQPGLVMRVAMPRNIHQQGQVSIYYSICSVLGVGLIFSAVTLLLLEQLVLSRLSHLSNKIRRINSSGKLSAQVESNAGEDELFHLAETIDAMLAALANSQSKQRETEERYYKYSRILAELTKSQNLENGDLNARLQAITEIAANTLEVERVSVWLYDAANMKVQCVDLYQKSTGEHSAGMDLVITDYPAYRQAIEQERSIATNDVSIDSRTRQLFDRYLSKFGIRSMLNAPIYLNGEIVGILCHGHVGSNRKWLLEEQNFAGSLAGLVALVMEASERKRSQEALEKAYEEIETRIRERTSELVKANEQLQAQIIERHIAEEKLIHEAFHDALTDLPNRAFFMQRLESAVKKVKTEKRLLAVLFLDLDGFKAINDSLGHLVGDKLLVAFSRRLQACLRPGDLVARLGGDEFTILLDDINDISDATKIADRIQHELTKPFHLDGHEVFTTASIGIALSDKDYDRLEDLLHDADISMYRAKSLGKARYEVFAPNAYTQGITLLHWKEDLQLAIAPPRIAS